MSTNTRTGDLTPEQKRELLAQLLREKAQKSAPPQLPPIIPAPDQHYDPFSLTDVQQAYWIGRGSNLELGNVACHLYFELDAKPQDLETYGAAWQTLIDRHDMLRAIILPDGRQQILENVPPYKIELLDLRDEDAEQAEARRVALRQEMSHQVLPADRWPLFEIRASVFNDQSMRLHMSFDLLIADFWSLQILFKELIYLIKRPELSLPPLEISFRDYVTAEQKLRETPRYQRAKEYWLNRISSLPAAPELPLAQSPSSITQATFIRRALRLEPNVWQQIKRQAMDAGLTASGVLLTAFAEVLNAWSKSNHFTINLTLFNRLPLHPQVNQLVGDFTSITLLEVDQRHAESFVNRAHHLRKQLWSDMDHRFFSGVEALRELNRQRGGASRILLPVVFTSGVSLSRMSQDTNTPGMPGNMLHGITQTPQVWLDHQVFEHDGSLVFNWDAVEDLFPPGLLDDMFDAYCRLIDRLAHDEAAWHETTRQLIPAAQLAQRVATNATEAPLSDQLLHDPFDQHAQQQPNRIAVAHADFSLTYDELRRRALQVATKLRALGARPNKLIAVTMSKGWEQVVGVLAVLYSGSAYLPLDPTLPKERLRYLLENGEVDIALTQTSLAQTLAWPENVRLITVDRADEVQASVTNLPALQKPEDLAYVIFTSGSTGVPKGVMIDHRGAVNTIADINSRFSVGPEDRVLALSSLSFDLSVYDIFGTLAAGGAIVIPDASGLRDPACWAELIASRKVTIWNSVPALMNMFVDFVAGQPETTVWPLRLVLLSGDWIPVSLPAQIRALAPEARLISLGGATEASIWSIYYPIAEVDPAWTSIPYGRPLTNQRFYVLNQSFELCPTWAPGQLYIGGVGLAQGYWKDEEKTRDSFVRHPRTGESLYHTRDLGRYLPDGNIEFLGREDFQVKIRGYRIELGEIEATLLRHPAVQSAAVVAKGDSNYDKRLIAYVVPREHIEASSNGDGPAPQVNFGEFDSKHLEGVLLDPVERIAFSAQQHNLVKNIGDRPAIYLQSPEYDAELRRIYAGRRSQRQFSARAIPVEAFGNLLGCLMATTTDGRIRYLYASAGGLYPVQCYVHIKKHRIEGLLPGFYYYQPVDHQLVLISKDASLDRSVHAPVNQAVFEESAFSIFLIGQLKAIAPMYGLLARDFCLLEAGYISQLLMTTAPFEQMGLCPIGALDFEKVRQSMRLEESQIFLHCLVGGAVSDNGAEGTATVPKAASTMQAIADHFNPADGRQALTQQLQGFLREQLPDYMLPSTLVLLGSLPLSAEGKVDRQALIESEVAQPQPKIFVAPRTEMERQLAQIIQEVIDVERVGVQDNFFDLGANSLQLVQVHTRLRDFLGKDIQIVDLFRYPSIEAFLKAMEGSDEQQMLEEAQDRSAVRREAMRQRRQQSRRSLEVRSGDQNE